MKRLLLALIAAFAVGGLFAQDIDLPAPQKTGGMPLMEALAKRATSRAAYDPKELTPQQLSDLLWATCGINRPDGRRTAPSASNRQEVDVYVILAKGAYLYDAKAHKLVQVVAEDLRALNGSRGSVKDAAVTLVYVADLAKMGNGTPESKKSTASIDTGYLSQNAYLYAASAGLASGYRGTVDRAALGPKLKLRDDQTIIGIQSVGYSKS